MQIDYDQAAEIFSKDFSDLLRSPYLHPSYVAADAQRDRSLSPVFFVFKENGHTFYYPFHVCQVPLQDLFDIQSPYGYGGPLSSTEDKTFLDNAWKAFHSWCAENAILAEFVRFHPLLGNDRIFEGTVEQDRNTVWVNLAEPDLLATYTPRARTAIRKAEKTGLRVEWWKPLEFTPMFQDLYSLRMKSLDANPYYFFPEDYFRALTRWDCACLGVCVRGEEVCAAAIFLNGPTHLEYHLSASTDSGQKFSATNLLIHEAGLLGQKLGCQALNLGGGTDATPQNPLLFFKSGFSALKAPFHIGKRIHLPERYCDLKMAWEKNNRRTSNRILFYR